ncbi:MAG: hypothetical protein IM541_06265 [Chitinophagaceae bacterium]|jgi:hypothetical protein|nr:hypothetical protein [Chitinophagaceae bacterium]MCE2974535.1 hypothetical protein [Sediminibacterium sp.]MCA6467029.1 hypothetical protein [Chitinophagaceae bacterium]MCA6469111.1 hypothetical protein [Chitinophagaceae bacterium]MCA6472903.1 hypothetical protein [Chitinophagaceae bacterium]
MKEITDEDLILYIYNEAPPVLKALIEKELNQKKGVIVQRMNQLKGTLHQLELKKLPSPSPASIQQLLQKAGIKSTSRKTGK